MTINGKLLGRLTFSRFIKDNGGVYLSAVGRAYIFRGDPAIADLVRSQGFEVTFHNPTDRNASTVSNRKAASRNINTFSAVAPIGALVV